MKVALSEFLSAAIEANEQVAKFLAENKSAEIFEYADHTEKGIGYGGDRSLKIDLIAEKFFLDKLHKFGRIDSEECGPVGGGADEIVIDPIDGSANLASQIPYYGSSIALKQNGVVTESIVCNLACGEYFARDSRGVFKSKLFDKNRARLPILRSPNSPTGIFEKAYQRPEETKKLIREGLKFRSPGALALSLAYARAAKFMLSMGRHRDYDIIAGLHLNSDLRSYISGGLIIISADPAEFERVKNLFVKG
ncbi:MAG: inositol monophosphatase [Helicobacteraceae bacterium]|jgi:myo-inositol-1(or 4)-monophosphatase|nr:inositol monophosphatase [Helicobacteraceae bacterium]